MTDHDTLCRRGDDCVDARRYTNTLLDGTTQRVRIPATATTPDGICRMDATLVHRAIQQLPADYAELAGLLGKTSASLDAPVHYSRELPVPIRLGIEALQAAILDELERWAWPVAEAHGTDYSENGRPGYRVQHAAELIDTRWPSLLDVPVMAVMRWHSDEVLTRDEDGVDGALALLALHEQVTAVAGRTHRARRLWTPCPKCERLALEHPEGASHVDCRACGNRMPLERYEELATILARAYRAAA